MEPRQDVDVIGHHHERIEDIPLAIEVPEVLDDDPSGVRPAERAGSQAGIEILRGASNS
jgi:hypothetical protein